MIKSFLMQQMTNALEECDILIKYLLVPYENKRDMDKVVLRHKKNSYAFLNFSNHYNVCHT